MYLAVGVAENVAVAPRVWCSWQFFQGAGIDAVNTCVDDATGQASSGDLIFHAVYASSWLFINVLVSIACLWPKLVRESWEKVEEGQIGITETTLKRTSNVINLSKGEDAGAMV